MYKKSSNRFSGQLSFDLQSKLPSASRNTPGYLQRRLWIVTMLLENTSIKKNSFSIENLAKSSVDNAKESKRSEHLSEEHGYIHYPPHLLPRVPALVPIYPSEAPSNRNEPENNGIQGRKRHNSTGSSTDAESLSDSKEFSFGKSTSSELDNRTPSPIGSGKYKYFKDMIRISLIRK